ncbi:MAG: ribosomal RNA small subunit methyltransferase A, partial [Desulfobacula sp.]|nr:ribosomal RNA small subunit methyltransferase A [Desulfobacula sp.]
MTHPGQLLKNANLYAGKELGQNFLSNPATAQMIVQKIGISKKTCVLEIGPGLGALTIPLAKAALHVT